MKYRITTTNMPALDIRLDRGESVFTERGGMAWMRGPIEMDTNMKGGLMKGLGRALAGESLFMTTYTSQADGSIITFTPEFVGSIVIKELAAGETIIAQRDAFMCAQEGVELAVHFQKRLGAGLFGGEGFILQKVTGPGVAFFEISGETVEYELAQGESMRIDPGHIALFDSTISYDIERVKGISNVMFGGEGLFLARLTGPGKVYLQTMPLANLIAKVIAQIPSG